MKKRILLVAFLVALMVVALAVHVFADGSNSETVTLKDGTSLSLWDEDGSGLIWYISGTDENGKYVYDSVSNLQQDSTLGKAYVTYTSNSKPTTYYNMTGITIVDENGKTYDIKQIVVANLKYSAEKPLCLPNHSVGFNSFGDAIFRSCTKLEYVLVPDALIKVPVNCFNGCSSLKEFDASNTNLQEFYGASFQDCTSLVSVSFPSCLDSFDGKNTFYGCTNLKEANGINEVFKNIADDEGIIPYGLFRNCSSLETDIMFYEGITSIGDYAFIRCAKVGSFKNLKIPNSVTAIGRSCFNACTQIETVRLSSSLTALSVTVYFGLQLQGLHKIEGNLYSCFA